MANIKIVLDYNPVSGEILIPDSGTYIAAFTGLELHELIEPTIESINQYTIVELVKLGISTDNIIKLKRQQPIMSELVELEIEVVARSDLAICIENMNQEMVYIPYSMIDDYSGDKQRPDSIFIPQWLAEKKELV